ncbi:TspO/MBR family protein [Halomarina ordinaria]|uniref:TspO/MBR family protein n=1 Tax=Halomarina ordinaria TaxID=3033939 RepID=A0ABD5UA00_9EURY|nr:TspO/MBR family protein [Halomarina sp. PSRA2]
MEAVSSRRLPDLRALAGLVLAVLACELVGITAAVFTQTGLSTWYGTLTRPELAPPNWVFGPVWTTLYALMGVAVWLAWRNGTGRARTVAVSLFVVQLALNFSWSFVFFGAQEILAALAVIVALLVAIVATMAAFWRVDRRAAPLMVPYLAWVAFATYLNYGFWTLN